MKEQEIDDHIIEACCQGNRAAFQVLFEAYKDRVFSIAVHFSSNETTARDITQQVFLKLFTQIGQFRRSSDFSTWLYRIVVNACVDDYRTRKRFLSFGQRVEMPALELPNSQEDCHFKRQISDAVKTAVGALSPKIRMVIVLKYVEGLSYEEISLVMGVSPGTVASRLNRGHIILARKLAHLRGLLDS